MRPLLLIKLAVLCGLGFARGETLLAAEKQITAERLGLPKLNERTSDPFVVRVYKADEVGRIRTSQPQDYPMSLREDHRLANDEVVRVHEGVDLQSRLTPKLPPTPLEFRAGVHGTVTKAGDGPWGTISVVLHDGTVIQYLHTSKSYVAVNDVVRPDTKLGLTGRKGANEIHLHIQAKRNDSAISPDLAFQIGQRPLESKVKPELPSDVEFDPDLYCPIEPTIIDGVVKACAAPTTKWIVEVIGMGGSVDIVLGEFYTYTSASHCALSWAKANPDDLRLTREREVSIK